MQRDQDQKANVPSGILFVFGSFATARSLPTTVIAEQLLLEIWLIAHSKSKVHKFYTIREAVKHVLSKVSSTSSVFDADYP